MLKDMYRNFEWRVDRVLDKHFAKVQTKRDRKRFKKICKQYEIPKSAEKMCILMYEHLKQRVGEKPSKDVMNLRNEDESRYLAYQVLYTKLYLFVKEMSYLIPYGFFTSALGLTREMLGLFVTLIYARHNPHAYAVLSGHIKGNLPSIGEMLKKLKSKGIKYPALGIDKEGNAFDIELVGDLGSEYGHLSNLHHQTPTSFSPMVWAVKEGKPHKQMEPYMTRDRKTLDVPKELMVVRNQQFIFTEQKQYLINTFFKYCPLMIVEIERIVDKKKT
jgi:hypothetical protein